MASLVKQNGSKNYFVVYRKQVGKKIKQIWRSTGTDNLDKATDFLNDVGLVLKTRNGNERRKNILEEAAGKKYVAQSNLNNSSVFCREP